MCSNTRKVILLFALFLLIPFHVRAAVVVNEIMPNPSGPSSEDTEWIELYNTGPGNVDLSDWKLDDIDGGGSSPYTIASGSSIAASSFLVFEKSTTNVALNNSGDTVRLIDAGGTLLDSHAYSSTTQDVSIGRSSDGGGSWATCAAPTKGGPNNCPLPSNTPTPAPNSTSSPTPKSSQPTNTPTPTPTTAVLATVLPSKTPTKKPAAVSPFPQTPSPSSEVLGLETTVIATSEASLAAQSVMSIVIPLLLVAVGLALVALVLVIRKRNALTPPSSP